MVLGKGTHKISQRAKPSTAPTTHADVVQEHSIPYRGYVDHGIPVVEDFDALPDESEPSVDDLVAWESADDHEPAAIPVYTVSGPGDRPIVHDYHTMYAAASSNPVQLAGRHIGRTKLLIRNGGSRTLYIGHSLYGLEMTGWPIPAGSTYTVTSSREVFGMISAYTPNIAPTAAVAPIDTTGWSATNGTITVVTAPWNPSRNAVQLTGTAAGYNVSIPASSTSFRAGQTVFYRFKIAWITGTTPAMYVRPWDALGAVTNLTAITAATITNSAGWVEITGSFIMPRDVTNLYLRIGSSAGVTADVYDVGDVSLSPDVDPGMFYNSGYMLDNQPVNLYEEFDASV